MNVKLLSSVKNKTKGMLINLLTFGIGGFQMISSIRRENWG